MDGGANFGYCEGLARPWGGEEFARHLDEIYNAHRDLKKRLQATEERMAHYEQQANRFERLSNLYEGHLKCLLAAAPESFEMMRKIYRGAAEVASCSTPT